MRTKENTENFMLPLDKVIKQKLILALLNDFQISEELRSLMAFPCKLDGMWIINPTEMPYKRIHKLARINQEISKLFYTTRTQVHSIRR